MTRALAKATDLDEDILAYKLMGNWDPKKITFTQLILEENEEDYLSKPYPFTWHTQLKMKWKPWET